MPSSSHVEDLSLGKLMWRSSYPRLAFYAVSEGHVRADAVEAVRAVWIERLSR